MKNIFKFFGAFLTVALSAALTGCMPEEQLETADLGLHIKVFSPTKVVAGQPMTINGSGFSDVTEIVFPDGVSVTDFEIVSNDMIRVKAPKGILAEGGNIIVRTEAGEEAVSPLPLTLGETKISGCSLEAGAEVEGGSQITIYGTDLEFVTGIEVKDEEGNPLLVEDELFHKKSTSTIIFTVPRKVFEGEFEPVIYTVDEKTFKMPMLKFKPAADGGYWDIVEHVIWENADPEGNGSVSWSSQYRFHGEGLPDTNNECIATIAAADWDIIKNGTFYLKFAPAADAYQIRANTGWWSFDGAGEFDIHGGDERIIDNGDGTFSLAYTLSEEPLASGILGLIDEQHLLFTGDGYTPLMLYTQEEVWVEGGGTVEIVRTSIWKNDGSVGAASWSAHIYRFGMEGTDANNECIATIAPEVWEKMKTTPFNVQVQAAADWWSVRMLDGWWTIGNDEANDISPNTPDRYVDNGDGTYTFVVDLQNYPNPDTPLASVVDAQHLLFAGADFIILEMYWEEEVIVPGGGGEPTETVFWENDGSVGEGNWGNNYRFAGEGTYSDEAVGVIQADHWESIKTAPFKVLVQPVAEQWQIRVITGYWGAQWPKTHVTDGEFDIKPETVLLSEYPDIIVDNGDGTYTLNLNFAGHDIATLIDEQNLLFAGQGFQILKIFTSEEVWVEGGGTVEIVRTSIWKNDGSVGAANWDGTYRFAMEGKDALGECVAEIPVDIWEKMKTTPFNVQITPAADWWQVRILDGHWSIGNSESNDISPNTPDKFIDNGDGTFTFVVDLQAYPEEGDKLVTTVDEKHFLMSGSGFIVNEMYWEEEVFVPGGGASETVVWENDGSFGVANWSNHFYRFCLEGKDANGECAGEIAAEHWEHMKASPFKVQIQQGEDWWQVRILDGHWSIGNSESNDISPNTPDKFVDNGDGTFTFEVDLQTYPDTDNPLVTTVDEKHLLFAGAGFIIQKIFYE